MASLAPMIAEYLAGPLLLRAALKGMTADQLKARPVPGKWSTLEVVCHLADFEPILADRIKRVLALERPTLMGADENCFVTALAYHDRDVEEELTIIEKTRSQLARILRHCGDDILTRNGVHSERGPRTLEQLLATATNHIPHHVKFIQEKRAALGV